ncbi:hypothetical protein V8E53_007908 [Lactarius tabidus]
MPNESPFPYTPRPENGPLPRAEVHLPAYTHGNVPLQSGRQPSANHGGPYQGRNDTNYVNWAQYHYNGWNEGPTPQSANLEGQYAYQGNRNAGYAPTGNPQQVRYPADPGPPSMEYPTPPTHGISNGGQAPPTAVPDVADPFSQNVPNSDHSRMPAMGDLRRLAYRYLHNPDSRVDTLRIWLNPSGHRFMVMILLEVDDIV